MYVVIYNVFNVRQRIITLMELYVAIACLNVFNVHKIVDVQYVKACLEI